jgi:hypothetical protein
MTWRTALLVVAGGFGAAFAACDRSRSRDDTAFGQVSHAGVTALEPGIPDLASAAAHGQTIFVPAYSAVATGDNSALYPLAITLSVRNTDQKQPIVLTAVAYHHQDGHQVHAFLKSPVRVAPLAAAEFFVSESDMSGGTVSSFLVEWKSTSPVSDPIVESLMVGTASNQGISFTCPGRVIADLGR